MIGGIDKQGGGKVEKFQVIFNLTPSNAILVVKDLQGQIIQPIQENNIYELVAGIYTYTVSAEGYIEKEETRLEVYQETSVDVQLQKSLETPPFSTATDEQLEKMLTAHYNGEIDIADYWKVGDTRLVHLNAISSTSDVSESHVEQDMTMVILDFNHDNLKEQLGSRDKAAVTIQCREILGKNGTSESAYWWRRKSLC